MTDNEKIKALLWGILITLSIVLGVGISSCMELQKVRHVIEAKP